jgi:hypothetical protein
MIVNIGSQPRRVAVLGSGRPSLSAALAIALAHGGYIAELNGPVTPITATRFTPFDIERIEAAEAKRQRRIKRNQQRSN